MPMKNKELNFIYSLALALYENDLKWSSVLLAEYLFKETRSLDPLVLLLKGLFQIHCEHRVVSFLDENSHWLEDDRIKLIYYKAKVRLNEKERTKTVSLEVSQLVSPEAKKGTKSFCEGNENILNKSLEGEECGFEEVGLSAEGLSIKAESVLKFYEALTKPDTIKTKLLVEAFKLDNLNLESLFFLFKDERLTRREFKRLLETGHKTIQKISNVLFYDPEDDEGPTNLFRVYRTNFYDLPFYNPLYIFLFSKDLFYRKEKQLLFNLSFASLKLYPESVYSYLSLAIYFLLLNDFKEAKKCLMKGAEIEKSGHLYFYLGICYSGLRECENALSCFNISHRILAESWKPLYYLAWELQKMTNYEKAIYFYKEGLTIERHHSLQERYVSLLIFCEYYEEALSYLASMNNPKHNLLRVFCLLFKGRINESKEFLGMCEKDWRFYATSAYIEHLLNNLEVAVDLYCKSLLINRDAVLEDLMTLALDNLALKAENDVYKYCTELFESLFNNTNSFDVV